MQIIIYSKGRLFQRYKESIDWNQVVAIADKNAGADEVVEGKQVLLPCEIQKLQYDYIVIFSDVYFYDIRKELIREHFIGSESIIPWRAFFKKEYEAGIFLSIKKFIEVYNIKSMLDVGMSIIPKYIFSKDEICSESGISIDGIGVSEFLFYNQIYNRIYKNLDEAAAFYDLIYINDVWSIDTNCLTKILKHRFRYILFRASYIDYSKDKMEEQLSKIRHFGKVKKFYFLDSIYLLLSDESRSIPVIDVEIYVVTHKEYNLLNNDLYRPLCVGNKYKNIEYLSEQDGDNISYLNDRINECTALYWIWKNTTSEYVGLNHYRRYFYNFDIISEDNYLDKECIYRIFEEYDIILPQYLSLGNVTVEEQLRQSINKELYNDGYNIMRSAIEKHQPDYLDAFDATMKEHKLFICNMFVTHRKIFNEYCEWLFPFLIEAAESIDVSGYDSYSKRVIGFFAERMMTVWLLKHNFRIKELPFDIVK